MKRGKGKKEKRKEKKRGKESSDNFKYIDENIDLKNWFVKFDNAIYGEYVSDGSYVRLIWKLTTIIGRYRFWLTRPIQILQRLLNIRNRSFELI